MTDLPELKQTAYRVLIVEDDTMVGGAAAALLRRLGHEVVGQADTAAQAVELFRTGKPDLVLMDIKLKADDGLKISRQLLQERPVPIVILSAFSENELIQRAASAGVFGYLIKPPTVATLAAGIAVAIQRFDEQQKLVEENDALARTLATRKLVERAKGVLMSRLQLPEPEAHKRLQIESQKRRLTIGEMAQRVIDSEDLFSK